MKNGDKFVYVDHLLAEHRRLDQLIRRTLATFPTWEETDASQWLPRMRAGLVAIRVELARHFREEEDGGCLEEAVARNPQISAEVERIVAQHGDLLADLDGLICRCQAAGPLSVQQMQTMEAEVRELVRAVRSHEARENRILERGFSVCLEGEDAGEVAPAVHGSRPGS
jgi:hypothetical protein